MKQLSRQAFERAAHFLDTQGRPLDQALFRHAFASGAIGDASADVVRALAELQNPDGGFGHGLETDVRTPTSSALATSIGLGALADIGIVADEPQVAAAVRYLLDTVDEHSKVWRIVPRDVNAYPHAPWWHDEGDSLAQGFGGFAVNPRAELVGQLHTYAAAGVPADWLEDLTERTVATIESRELDVHELICAVRLAETQALPARFKERLGPRVTALVLKTISRDPAAWKEYNPQPLWYAASPSALVASELGDEIATNLDFLIEQQANDGSWGPTWSWGDFYPETWPQARQDAASMLTRKTLNQLRAFERIEGEQ
jgi:hypothetical protein